MSRPPRIPPLGPKEASEEVRPIFERYLKERGNIPNMFRTVARLPRHLHTMIDHFQCVMREGSVAPRLKELISIRVSALNGCEY